MAATENGKLMCERFSHGALFDSDERLESPNRRVGDGG